MHQMFYYEYYTGGSYDHLAIPSRGAVQQMIDQNELVMKTAYVQTNVDSASIQKINGRLGSNQRFTGGI